MLFKSYVIHLELLHPIHIDYINKWIDTLNLQTIDQDSNKELMVAKVALELADILFYAIKLPIFYEENITDVNVIKKRGKIYTFQVILAYVEGIEEQYVTNVLNYAFKLAFWLSYNACSIENKEIFFQSCMQELIEPLRARMPIGKSTYHILKAAWKNRIPFLHLEAGVYQLGYGANSRKLDRSSVDADSAMGAKLSSNKHISANILKKAGLPTAKEYVVSNIAQAQEAARKLTFPVVVKPLAMERGDGVMINIYDNETLEQAIEFAQHKSKQKSILIQQQAKGVCYRVHIVNKQLLFVMKRLPVSVQADGKSTIKELIIQANEKQMQKFPWQRDDLLCLDELTLKELKKSNYTPQSVPKKDEWIALREFETNRFGGRGEDVTSHIHQDNIDIALKAAALFDLYVAGVDIITEDISKPWHESEAIISEVNYAPMFGHNTIYQNKMKSFFNIFLKNKGYIPVEIFIGANQQTLQEAKNKQQEHLKNKTQCYLTSHDMSLDNNCKQMKYFTHSLIQRVLFLIMDKSVEAVVVVIATDEVLHHPFFFQKINSVRIVQKKLKSHVDHTLVDASVFQKVQKLFEV